MKNSTEKTKIQRAKNGLKVVVKYYDKAIKNLDSGTTIPLMDRLGYKDKSKEYIRGLEFFVAGMIFGIEVTGDTPLNIGGED